MQREGVPFCRTSFQIAFFCHWKHIAVDLEFFVLPTLEKIQPNFAYWCLVRDLGGITFCKKGNSLCFQRMLWKSSLYTFPSSLFLILRMYTELIVTVFNRAENCSTLVWDTVFCSLSKKSRLLNTILTTTSGKTVQLTTALSHYFCDFFKTFELSQVEDSCANK